jgi:hypothetical protein
MDYRISSRGAGRSPDELRVIVDAEVRAWLSPSAVKNSDRVRAVRPRHGPRRIHGTAERVLLISTPTEKGLSRIERLYGATDGAAPKSRP